KPGAALAACLLAHLGELFGARIAAVGLAACKQFLDRRAVAGGAGELVDGLAVPIDAEPGEPIEDGVDRRLGRALAVGVLDAQEHLAAAPARVKPVEQRGAGAADMEKSGRRGSKAGNDGLGHARPLPQARARGDSPSSGRLNFPPRRASEDAIVTLSDQKAEEEG